jgi:hypothetical protein
MFQRVRNGRFRFAGELSRWYRGEPKKLGYAYTHIFFLDKNPLMILFLPKLSSPTLLAEAGEK